MYSLFARFFIGIAILLLSTQTLVKLADKLARRFGISPLIIGLTLVAVGTSLPELTVSLFAILRQDAGLAYGNIVGSNIINILLVFPAGIIGNRLRIGTTKTQWNSLLLVALTFSFLALNLFPLPIVFVALALLGAAVLVTLGEYYQGILGRTHEDKKFVSLSSKKAAFGGPELIALGLSGLGIAWGGILVVNSIESISTVTGIGTTVLGLTLAAIATSLPELLATITSRRADAGKLTVGNIIGSNIYNLLLVGGLISLFSVSRLDRSTWVWLAGATITFALVIRYFRGKTVPSWVGVAMLLGFIGYIVSLSLG